MDRPHSYLLYGDYYFYKLKNVFNTVMDRPHSYFLYGDYYFYKLENVLNTVMDRLWIAVIVALRVKRYSGETVLCEPQNKTME